MKHNKLDAYLLQETHLAGDFERHLMFDYYLIHHGPEIQPPNEAKGGVAIILSPELDKRTPKKNLTQPLPNLYLLSAFGIQGQRL